MSLHSSFKVSLGSPIVDKAALADRARAAWGPSAVLQTTMPIPAGGPEYELRWVRRGRGLRVWTQTARFALYGIGFLDVRLEGATNLACTFVRMPFISVMKRAGTICRAFTLMFVLAALGAVVVFEPRDTMLSALLRVAACLTPVVVFLWLNVGWWERKTNAHRFPDADEVQRFHAILEARVREAFEKS